ncbi:MAG: hypothetical protein QF535_09125 [Anaerolineales bacterium]|jgi:hypothetical protein|nr:hypothetical protein [Anaerolineales bacterium]|tara:strand:- start:1225 stop:1623 length:399 start_codon:yes stop_codon:yes gene_type:complete
MARPYFGGSSPCIKALAADTTLSLADSGKKFICSQVGAYNITLPAVGDAKGWEGTFVLGTAGANDFDIIGGTADVMVGVDCGDANTAIDNADKVTFASGSAVVGERIDIFCDGTNYYVTMFAASDAGTSSSG